MARVLGTYMPKERNYTVIIPVKKRKLVKSPNATKYALSALKDFKRFAMISVTEYEELRTQVRKAKSDDEVSSIMCKLRHRIYKR